MLVELVHFLFELASDLLNRILEQIVGNIAMLHKVFYVFYNEYLRVTCSYM